jgi:pimeloyl-ACP methyl ester carboxylesterase
MAKPRSVALTAQVDGVDLAGTLWLPDGDLGDPIALLTMHPGSGPSDRHNDVFFPPIREALLQAQIAVASFDKRGVGGSGGTWLEAGIEQQARDLLAAHAAASAEVGRVPAGVFGHSQGGWVVLEALRVARSLPSDRSRPAFGISSSGPGVSTADQERFAAAATIGNLFDDPEVAMRAHDAAATAISMYESGTSSDALAFWADDPGNADAAELIRRMYGSELFDASLWNHLVELAAFDPVPAMESIDVPLLAVFGSEDTVTPVEASIAALTAHVRPEDLHIAVVADGNHRMQRAGRQDFASGYPDVLIDFISTRVPGR